MHDPSISARDEPPPFVERPRLLAWLDDGSSYRLTRSVMLRILGLVYLVTFVATFREGPALIGEHGLLPMRAHLAAVLRHTGSAPAAFYNAPSVFWISPTDATLRALAAVGACLSVAVMLGVTNAWAMLLLFALQTSLANVGQIFWGYGWELQLIETGMLAAVLCPMRSWRPFAAPPPPFVTILLFRWLVVRIMLGAGLIKLRGDPCWRDFTCLVTHYETQPNPSPFSWVLHQMPRGFHVAGVAFNHLVELVVPLFVFGPRRVRRAAGALLVAFQLILIASGNLAFLNWLTIVPALACFDDALLERLLPRRIRAHVASPAASREPSRAHRAVAGAYALVVAVLSVQPVANLLSSRQRMNASFDPLHLVNTYGAFGRVHRVRDEIVIQGTRDEAPSDDARWEEYELPCKPGDPIRRPCLVTPYHHRLDWQMWFAALSSYDRSPWLAALVDKLVAGDPSVRPLIASDPFERSGPPRFVRLELYRYELTRFGDGPAWWRRHRLGEYMRPVSRDDPAPRRPSPEQARP